MTPLFPKTAKTFATCLEPGPSDLVASKARQFVEMASRRFQGSQTYFYADLQRVKLPPEAKLVEHVRGMEFEIWASTSKRIGWGQ
jgi:hypothetical protein